MDMQQIYVYFRQVNNNLKLSFSLELLWLLVPIILIAVIFILVGEYISKDYFVYLAVTAFLSIFFFRLLLFLPQVGWMQTFWPKIILIFICVPGIFVILNYRQLYNQAFENYTFNGIGYADNFILRYTSYENLMLIKLMTQVFSTACMFLMILLTFRLAFSIFKLRQVPWQNK